MYQNEDGEWVTDLAYYSSFEKEVDGNMPEDISQFQTEDFVPSSAYMVLCFRVLKCFLYCSVDYWMIWYIFVLCR